MSARKTKREISSDKINYFIDWVKNLLGDDIAFEKEPHGDEGAVYRIKTLNGNFFLKIKNNSTFEKEREKLLWLEGRLPVPKVVDFTEKDKTGALLITALEGKNLAVLCKEWPAEKVIEKLAEVIHRFHATSIFDLTSGDKIDSSKILVHGDACLPNFIFNGDLFSGYIDLADSRFGNKEVDLSAAVWSIEYNMGPGYGHKFLEKYGYSEATEKIAEKLRLDYIDYQQKCGFSV